MATTSEYQCAACARTFATVRGLTHHCTSMHSETVGAARPPVAQPPPLPQAGAVSPLVTVLRAAADQLREDLAAVERAIQVVERRG